MNFGSSSDGVEERGLFRGSTAPALSRTLGRTVVPAGVTGGSVGEDRLLRYLVLVEFHHTVDSSGRDGHRVETS